MISLLFTRHALGKIQCDETIKKAYGEFKLTGNKTYCYEVNQMDQRALFVFGKELTFEGEYTDNGNPQSFKSTEGYGAQLGPFAGTIAFSSPETQNVFLANAAASLKLDRGQFIQDQIVTLITKVKGTGQVTAKNGQSKNAIIINPYNTTVDVQSDDSYSTQVGTAVLGKAHSHAFKGRVFNILTGSDAEEDLSTSGDDCDSGSTPGGGGDDPSGGGGEDPSGGGGEDPSGGGGEDPFGGGGEDPSGGGGWWNRRKTLSNSRKAADSQINSKATFSYGAAEQDPRIPELEFEVPQKPGPIVEPPPSSGGNHLNAGVVAAIIISVTIVVGLIVGVVLYFFLKKKKNPENGFKPL